MYFFLLVWLVPFLFVPVILEGRKRTGAIRAKAQEALEENDLRGATGSTRELVVMLLPKKGFGQNEVPVESPPDDDPGFYAYFHERFVPQRQAAMENLKRMLPPVLIPFPFVVIIFIAYILVAGQSLIYLVILLPPIMVIGVFCFFTLNEALENARFLQGMLLSIDERFSGLVSQPASG